MTGGMWNTPRATATAATKAYTAALHAGARRTARKKKSVQTGIAAASAESQGFPNGSKFCSHG